MIAKDGKKRKVRTANTKGILRIIQSIPSPKAEPFKLWLAQVGSERLEEIVNPELAINRAKETYIRKGYEDTWIAQRLKSIDSRKELKGDVQEAGKITGNARREIEKKIGKKVAEKTNYKNLTNDQVRKLPNKDKTIKI